MQDQESASFWAAVTAGIGAVGLSVTTWLKSRGGNQEGATRISLDRTQLALIDRLQSDLDRERKRSDEWERAARGVDELAHDLRHTMVNAIQRGDLKTPEPPRIPRLEDFF